MKPTEKITTIEEYIHVIAQNGLTNHISRGESKSYEHMCASAFRNRKYKEFDKMVQRFYSYIGNSLTDMQHDHFLSFAQHHGIPTNLLDFTSSPLVSLFFACNGDSNENGYVYFINKLKTVDITAFISDGVISNRKLIFERILALDKTVFVLVERLFNFFFEGNAADSFYEHWVMLYNRDKFPVNPAAFLQFIQSYNLAIENTTLANHIIATDIELITYIIDFVTMNDIHWYRRVLSDEEKKIKKHQLFALAFFLTHESMMYLDSEKVFFPWILTYSPPNIIERVSNQSSSFIYQLHASQPKYLTQMLSADYSIEVTNKTNILKELDYLGINQKFIFNDYDSIAKYVKDAW